MKKFIFFITILFVIFSKFLYSQVNEEIWKKAPISNRIGFIKAKFVKQSSSVKLTWKRVNENVNFKYRIYRDTRILDNDSKLSANNFVTEIDGVASSYYDRPEKSGRYYYAITIVNLKNKEIIQLVKDQSFTSSPVEAYIEPAPVTGIQISYELGRKRVILQWTPTDMGEVDKFRIYRDKKRISKPSKEILIAELSKEKREFKDVLSNSGRYFYLITTVNAFNKENGKVLPGGNYTKVPINVRFFTTSVEGVQGYGYYTEFDVNKAHPPIFFRFIEQLFKRKETFISYDINDVKSFKHIDKKLISLPVLPKKFRIDRTIERLTPVETQREKQKRNNALRDEAKERSEIKKQESKRRQEAIKQIFQQDKELIRRKEQNKKVERKKPETLRKQENMEKQNTPIKKPDDTKNASREKRTPEPREQEKPEVSRKRSIENKLSGEINKLRYIVNTLYYKRKDYRETMVQLYKLYSQTNFQAIKNRAIYFYARALYDMGKYSRSLKALLVLKGTRFYNKYKSEIDFMIKRAAKRK